VAEEMRDQDLGHRLGIALDELAARIREGHLDAPHSNGDYRALMWERLDEMDSHLFVGLGVGKAQPPLVEEDPRTSDQYADAIDACWGAMAVLARLADHMTAVRESKLAAIVVAAEGGEA
jgi:hypothetical protein